MFCDENVTFLHLGLHCLFVSEALLRTEKIPFQICKLSFHIVEIKFWRLITLAKQFYRDGNGQPLTNDNDIPLLAVWPNLYPTQSSGVKRSTIAVNLLDESVAYV